MSGSQRTSRFVVCVAVVALLGAGQQPSAVPPSAPQPQPATVPSLLPGDSVPFPVPPGSFQRAIPPARKFDLNFDTKASAKDLLPAAPKVAPSTGPVLTDDLKKIPEITFQSPQKDKDPVNEAARQIAKINHVNAQKTDAFMTTLLENRPDLAGMPFAMGDSCRTDGDRLKRLTQAAQTVREALSGPSSAPNAPPQPLRTSSVSPVTQRGSVPVTVVRFVSSQTADVISEVSGVSLPFWTQFNTLCEQQDTNVRRDKETVELVTVARIAALTQMLAAESPEMRLGLVKYLTGVPHVEATKALARMAIFSPENDIRAAAITALKVRRERDYTDVLVKGLRYPWPAVAKRAADAIAKLERTDLVSELVAVLDSTDPRLPTTKDVGGKQVSVVREMVKMNHHRNCLMCHAPTGSGTPNPDAITAEVAVQGQPLPQPSEGYRQSTQELMIRLDVTYLRQDFSASLPVKEAHPWPGSQRFDFFVRERTLTDEEVVSYRNQLTPKETGVLSPYHKAAVAALRELTGKDTAPTAEAWRKLLTVQTPR